MKISIFRILVPALVAALTAGNAHSLDSEGLLDLRWVDGDTSNSWLHEGLGKQRFDADHDGPQLGQLAFALRDQLFDTVTGYLAANGYEGRENFVDLTEAYLVWQPVPTQAWRWRSRIGAFFPPISLENSDRGWTSPYTLSSSALNTWVGEELRTIGAEVALQRPGRFADSPHDFDLRAAVFGWNDPAGTLLAWRGWAIGDRVTSLFERLPLANLPAINNFFYGQGQWEEPFHEIDNRYGYYASAEYRHVAGLTLRALHYDNNADPAAVEHDQWAWHTKFDSVGLRWAPADASWEFIGQWLGGDTYMGYEPDESVYADYEAWFALFSQHIGRHRWSVRYDHFRVDDEDLLSLDNNDEHGHGWTAAYFYDVLPTLQIGTEWLVVDSTRAARAYLNEPARQIEQTLQLALRWKF